jgi:hypothetical protein
VAPLGRGGNGTSTEVRGGGEWDSVGWRANGCLPDRWCLAWASGSGLDSFGRTCVTGAIGFYDSLVAMAPYFPLRKYLLSPYILCAVTPYRHLWFHSSGTGYTNLTVWD